jgi:hypothetical protein
VASSLQQWATLWAKRLLGIPPGPRRYLRAGMSVDRFFAELNARGANYAVLRWFDDLPKVEKGEDIDLLLADESMDILESLTRGTPPFPVTQKLDVYTVSGLPGTNFHAMPYLSRSLAARVVAGTVLLREKYRVPSPVDHFDSMAFHAVYHKGWASGLPEEVGETPVLGRPDHDYLTVLTALATTNGIDVEVSLRGLDRYFVRLGMRPASDTLERFQEVNPWLKGELDRVRPDIGDLTGLIVYVVREKAEGWRDDIVDALDAQGFEILKVFPLTPKQRELATAAIRGGNWGRGPFRESGGTPSSIIVAYDLAWRQGTDPLMNARAVGAKRVARDLVAAHVGSPDAFNPLHSTDNGWQSLEYIHVLDDPKLLPELEKSVAVLVAGMASPWPVVDTLGEQGRRARVDLVEHPVHGRSVFKVFRPGARASFDREVAARSVMADSDLIPPLLDAGDNWILSASYGDNGGHAVRRLPGSREVQLRFTDAQKLRAFVDLLRSRGHYLLDLTTHNIVTDPVAGMKILDLEFFVAYPGELPPLEQDSSVAGMPGKFGDPAASPIWPTETNWHNSVTRSLFRSSITGVSATALARSSGFTRLRASMVQLAWLAPFAIAAVALGVLETSSARRARGILRKVRNK